jgi:hypothetical protein
MSIIRSIGLLLLASSFADGTPGYEQMVPDTDYSVKLTAKPDAVPVLDTWEGKTVLLSQFGALKWKLKLPAEAGGIYTVMTADGCPHLLGGAVVSLSSVGGNVTEGSSYDYMVGYLSGRTEGQLTAAGKGGSKRMSKDEALRFCEEEPECKGFSYRGPRDFQGPKDIYFKNEFGTQDDLRNPAPDWSTYLLGAGSSSAGEDGTAGVEATICSGDRQPNAYRILGVSANAESSEIKRAYRQLSLQYHPDKLKDKRGKKATVDPAVAAKSFAAVSEAYEVLSDDKQRALYDKYGTNKQDEKLLKVGFYSWYFVVLMHHLSPHRYRIGTCT